MITTWSLNKTLSIYECLTNYLDRQNKFVFNNPSYKIYKVSSYSPSKQYIWNWNLLLFDSNLHSSSKKSLRFCLNSTKIRKKATTNLPFTKNNVFSCIMRISFHNLHIPFEWPYCAFSTHDMHHSFQGKPVFFRILTVCQNSKMHSMAFNCFYVLSDEMSCSLQFFVNREKTCMHSFMAGL